jgi:hypothetical protein
MPAFAGMTGQRADGGARPIIRDFNRTKYCKKGSAVRELKNCSYSRSGALALPQPMPRSNKSFLVLFFKKELLE